ncbi:MAG: SMC family ATPase [Geodermatophilaceae bacterium]
MIDHAALVTLSGTLEELIGDPRHDVHLADYVSARLLDATRPVDAMRRLRGRFSHCVHLDWAPTMENKRTGSYGERISGRNDLGIVTDFVQHVRTTPATRAEVDLLSAALAGRASRRGRLMRVHSLTVTAFGPFAGTVRVDLDELSQDGLFLLCGPTGAGKTSLLDAIAFALYGRVPGARGQEKRLRSDHASAAVRTQVVCELTLRGERIRITRRPEQVRPKARGGGTTRDQALLHVQRAVTGAWEPVSTRLDEGGDFLRSQVGLSPEQFWQVVLLPQGEFAEFLRAEPDQRAKVLETLFDARRFTAVEEWLAEHARSARATLTQAQDRVDRLLHRVEQVARGLTATERGAGMPARPESEDFDDIRAYLSGQRAAVSAQLIAAAAEDETTGTRLVAAENGRDRARAAVRAVARLLAVCRQRDFLAARSEQVADQRTRLSAALAAEPLRPFLDVDCANWKRTDEAAADLTEFYSDLIRLDVAARCPVRLQSAASRDLINSELRTISGSGSAGSELRRWNRVLRDEVARLENLESEWDTVKADESMLAVVCERQVSRQASLVDLHEISDRLPTALADLEARRDATRLAAAGMEHAAATLTAAQVRVEAAARAAALAELVGTAEAEHLASQREALGAKDRWLSLREIRLAGIAAELAGQLSDGRDCPVCGSPEHPSPAQPSDAAVSAQDEHAAADLHDRLEHESARVAARVLELRREYDACCSVTSGGTLAAVREVLSAAVTADAAAKAADAAVT